MKTKPKLRLPDATGVIRTYDVGEIRDIDLDAEEVVLEDGTRLTEALAEQIGEEISRVLAARRGRPSVTGDRARTPNLTVRVEPDVRDVLDAIASSRGTRVSAVAREALREYAERHKVS